MRVVAPRFIACEASLAAAAIVVYGIPFEGRVNLRKGADGGPLDVRLASDSIETYSPFLRRDLEDIALADGGDCVLPAGTPREQLDAARKEIADEGSNTFSVNPLSVPTAATSIRLAIPITFITTGIGNAVPRSGIFSMTGGDGSSSR